MSLARRYTDYKDGDGRQVWYVQAGPGGNHLSGNGKAVDVGYMYALTSAVGSCTAD